MMAPADISTACYMRGDRLWLKSFSLQIRTRNAIFAPCPKELLSPLR
jgi:hypothetical protein